MGEGKVARNHLEERLERIKNQKAIVRRQMKEETDRKKLMSLAEKMRVLGKEELDCLKKLGLR